MLLYRWYKAAKCPIRWNNGFSDTFCIKHGARQGSILSSYLLSIFLNDLLVDLKDVRIGDIKYNSFAYADDVTLLSPTAPGLQKFIDKCVAYSLLLRFGIKKTKCMVNGHGLVKFGKHFTWYLGDSELIVTGSQAILGSIFTNQNDLLQHVESVLKVVDKVFIVFPM